MRPMRGGKGIAVHTIVSPLFWFPQSGPPAELTLTSDPILRSWTVFTVYTDAGSLSVASLSGTCW